MECRQRKRIVCNFSVPGSWRHWYGKLGLTAYQYRHCTHCEWIVKMRPELIPEKRTLLASLQVKKQKDEKLKLYTLISFFTQCEYFIEMLEAPWF